MTVSAPAREGRKPLQLDGISEVLLELRLQFIAGRRVILPAAAGDLDRAEQRGQASGGLPVPALLDAVQQAGAIGIAASGRVEQRGRLGAGEDELLAVGGGGRGVG